MIVSDQMLSKKFPGNSNNKYLDLVKYAYWSCLQLERFTRSLLERSESSAN